MNLAAFRAAVAGFRRPTGHSQQELATALGLHPAVLSHKLHGSDGAALRHDEVRGIARTLAAWQAVTTRAQVVELLGLMDLRPTSFTSAEWTSPPLSQLEPGDAPLPPARARGPSRVAHPSSLLADLTPLVGRVEQIHQLLELLEGSARLVTLTGTGGVGKTRLALAAASAVIERSGGAVCVVELAPIRDPALVAGAIAAELGLGELTGAGRGIARALLDYLRERQMLLVLDNLEQVLGSTTLIGDVLRAAPGVRVLATSRVPLRVYGEHEFRVPPLRLPTPGDGEQQVLAREAVVLFVQRARAARPDLRLGPEQAAFLEAICRQLDGVPLAIELAAARTRHLPLPLLLDRLTHRLDLLTRGPADAPARQRTLRAMLDWSYQLLPRAQQRVFEQLGVFVGGWTLAAARAVCLPGGGEDLEEALWDLLDAALLERVDPSDQADGAPRFRMLQIVHEYALARLAASGQADLLARRHVDWCLTLVEPVAPRPPDPRTVARLAPELDNVRAALRWAIDAGAVADALSLAVALWLPWYVRGAYAEGRAWLSELLALPGAAAATPARATAEFAAGHLAHCQGDLAAAERLLGDAQRLADRLGLDLLRGAVVHQLGNVARARGDLERAVALYERGRAIFHQLGDAEWEATALMTMADALCFHGQPRRAAASAAASLASFTRHPNTWIQARTRYVLGRVAAQHGDHARARAWVESALALERELADQQGIAWSLLALAEDAVRRGDATAARGLLAESLTVAEKTGDRLMLARNLEGLASLLATESPDRAVRMAAAADAMRMSLGAAAIPVERRQLDRRLRAARRALGAAASSAVWTAGQATSPAQAAAEALRLTDSSMPPGVWQRRSVRPGAPAPEV
jgi:predicted ATPase